MSRSTKYETLDRDDRTVKCTERVTCSLCGREGWLSVWPDGGNPRNGNNPHIICADESNLICGRCAQMQQHAYNIRDLLDPEDIDIREFGLAVWDYLLEHLELKKK